MNFGNVPNVCMGACVFVYVHACICMCVCLLVCLCVHICVYVIKGTDDQTVTLPRPV